MRLTKRQSISIAVTTGADPVLLTACVAGAYFVSLEGAQAFANRPAAEDALMLVKGLGIVGAACLLFAVLVVLTMHWRDATERNIPYANTATLLVFGPVVMLFAMTGWFYAKYHLWTTDITGGDFADFSLMAMAIAESICIGAAIYCAEKICSSEN